MQHLTHAGFLALGFYYLFIFVQPHPPCWAMLGPWHCVKLEMMVGNDWWSRCAGWCGEKECFHCLWNIPRYGEENDEIGTGLDGAGGTVFVRVCIVLLHSLIDDVMQTPAATGGFSALTPGMKRTMCASVCWDCDAMWRVGVTVMSGRWTRHRGNTEWRQRVA